MKNCSSIALFVASLAIATSTSRNALFLESSYTSRNALSLLFGELAARLPAKLSLWRSHLPEMLSLWRAFPTAMISLWRTHLPAMISLWRAFPPAEFSALLLKLSRWSLSSRRIFCFCRSSFSLEELFLPQLPFLGELFVGAGNI